jgi:hypothetical protein
MGVITTFDEKIDIAKDSITAAYEALLECLKNETWGYDEKNKEYIDTVHEVTAELIKLKRKL